MKKLSEQIKMLSLEEKALLLADKLPKDRRNSVGLYLTIEADGTYTACDYSDRQIWLEEFPHTKKIPAGFVVNVADPIEAIDWLLDIRK